MPATTTRPAGTERMQSGHQRPRRYARGAVALVGGLLASAVLVGGWLDGALEVVDVEDILGERTVAENRDAGRLQMDQSTQVAVAVALEHLGYEIMTPIGARVERIMRDAPADGALREGDIVQAVGDSAIATAQQLADTIKTNEPGAAGTIHHDGTVGTVGGVPQKSHAVIRASTDLFLVPASQVEEAIAVAEPSVSVVGVETLDDALAAIEAHRP